MPFTHAVPFSSNQLAALASWGETCTCGLEVRLATDHEDLDEVAELFRAGQSFPAYCITAISTGEVDIIDADGAVDVTTELESALEWIERRETVLRPVTA